ncbi:MAG: GNAT family N-acetyltransferase [Gammaproteobacteria bacterium]|nr:GNAT family N-acetyltransferase [Gammaproteobacteria bacterium]
MNLQLKLSDEADQAVRRAIATPLNAFNDAKAGIDPWRPLVITLTDNAGAIVGGLWGSTGYTWLYVELLVVPETQRGSGIGTRLLALAESEARGRGCTSAWLDTFEFQARGFYERLGYECFGELKEYPPGFARFFMRKNLLAGTSA